MTGAVAVAPLWIGIWIADGNPLLSTIVSMLLALAIGRMGAALWQRTEASEDLVFDDLLAWGYLRRLRAQRGVLKSVRRLGLDGGTGYKSDALTRAEQTKLLRNLATALERGDPYTHGHSQRVARHAHQMAKVLQLSRKQSEKVRLAALLHDLGKLEVSRDVLNKPDKLTDAEFAHIKTHPGAGADMVAILGDQELTDMVRYHHERMDGSGYPEKLFGRDIPIGARIIAVADTFDAITSRRPYRSAQKHKVAMEILHKEAGVKLDSEVVHAFTVYYSGRRSIRWWFVLMAGWRHGLELALTGLPRVGLVGVANAAAVGGAAVVIAGGSMMHVLPETERAKPHERQGIARDAKEKGENPGRVISGEASDGTSTQHATDPDTVRSARTAGSGGTVTTSRTRSASRQQDGPGKAESDKAIENANVAASSNDSPSSSKTSAQDAKGPTAVPTQASRPESAGPKDTVGKVTDTVEDTVEKVPGTGATNAPLDASGGKTGKDN